MQSEVIKRQERPCELDKTRLKNALNTSTSSFSQFKKNQETIMIFGFGQYPFPNEDNSQTSLLKTIVNLELNTEKLERVIKLTHPNIIGLRKIVKSSPRQAYQGSKGQAYYSFYYQLIQYSLKELVEDPSKNQSLFHQIRMLNIKSILKSVVEYLEESGIYYIARIEDLGVSLDGTIKIYIPPNVVFQSTYDQTIHKAIVSISNWWDVVQRQTVKNFKKNKKVIQLQPPRLEDNGDLEFDDPSVQQSTLERELSEILGDEFQQNISNNLLKQSTNSQASQLSKLGSIQMAKFKKIDEEVKFIRQRLNQKTKNKPKQADNKEIKRSLNMFDNINKSNISEKTEEKLLKAENDYFKRQPIQQNINCINIYNTPNNVIPNSITIPKYFPNNFQPSPCYNNDLDPEFFRDHQEDYSQDTYDIQFETQFEMPNTATINSYRHTLVSPAERETSEYSQHSPKKAKQPWTSNRGKAKVHANQVCNKNVTQSAGPLQFKSFVNKFIKPQFLAKRSNIYEQPGQDDSEKSFQMSKKTQPESGLKKSTSNKNMRGMTSQKSLKFGKNLNKSVEKQPSIKRIHSQHEFNLRNKGVDNDIQQKVKKALEKTKNAIALLNRVKSKNTLKNFTSQ